MKKFSTRERMQYYFEQTIASGPTSLIKWLALISLFAVLLLGLLILVFGISSDPESTKGLGFLEGSWQSLMATLDSGTMGGDEGWLFRIVRFAATILGIFIISVLIGSISSGIDQKIDDLKRGRSKVLEENHTLILGWSEKIFSILSELAIANANQKKPSVVILSEKDKVEAEEEIQSKVDDLKNLKIVVRMGNPLDLNDVEIVNPNGAKSIIVLSAENSLSDMHVIKTVLGLTKSPHRKSEPYNIVAEIKDEENMEAAELVGNHEAIYILSTDIISRVAAQTSLQTGLSIVYSELLCFDGDEIYFKREDLLIGKTYRDALFTYNTSAVIGLFTSDGTVLINPPGDHIIHENDEIIAISEDDDTIIPNASSQINKASTLLEKLEQSEGKAQKTLILGWNNNGHKIIRELNNYVAPGSEILLVSEFSDSEINDINELQKGVNHIKLSSENGAINRLDTLEKINPDHFDNIIVLSSKELDVQESDAKTLICLLHLRNMGEKSGKSYNIVTEMLDIKNRVLGVVAKANDFIIGENLISLLLSQLSENIQLKKVFDVLLNSEGSEIYLKPAHQYMEIGKETDFNEVLANALEYGDTAFGYRKMKQEHSAEENFGIRINPKKDQKIIFDENDYIIVLSED
jgi:K+/H+ antiporter YhaU regulatory subunit KhtT